MKRQSELRDKITRRVHDKQNIKGFLIHSADKYQSCLGDIDNALLQSLLHEDLMYWEAISKGTMKNQSSFKDKIDTFLKE